ncbi:hypothetical protein U1E44_01695 [Arenibacter sp. GZD96]|uniref:hypothetical protein n=1 Tax=Aurantibrevibacter litoralis TaxID=3106030 RepID=UPI002AFE4277|nr:hypothetical protein [Arenibacter sp. GZD-96]MEA1784792.1 hypothetical protein [Arenibacter sp. GZD-96]
MLKITQLIFLVCTLTTITKLVAQDTFRDVFAIQAYFNNNGTHNFATNWIEANDNNAAASGFINIDAGNQELRFFYLWDENIRRSADLSAYASATLSFDWRTSSLEAGETLAVQASVNGSTFTTLATFGGSQSGTFSQDISAYISANTTIRFQKGGANWNQNNDRAFIDNVTITAALPQVDTDGDGIPDTVDLDDDNDGIPDTEEYCTTASAAFLVSADVGARSVTINHTDTGYLRLNFSSMDNSFQLTINGISVHPSVFEFENGALGAGEEYFVFDSDGAFINSPWVANSNGLPRLQLVVDALGQVSLYGTRTTGATTLERMRSQASTPFSTITWVPGSNNTFVITNQQGPGPEGFTGDFLASAICDTDGDGISNEKDLDSDNDGIYDIVESGVLNVSGVTDANNDGRIDGAMAAFGANGLFNAIEDNDFEFANLTYAVLDSDGDGITDPYELDADGDSCFDVVEAGYTDLNLDGILGPLPVLVDSQGKVTSGSDGYTTPNDMNVNSLFDFQEAGMAPTITSQPVNAVTCPGCVTTMTATSSGNMFQWQLFDGANWNDLTDSGMYSGTATTTLTITAPSTTDTNGQYRVLIRDDSFFCGETVSSVATLRIQVNTVISNRRITYRVNKN